MSSIQLADKAIHIIYVDNNRYNVTRVDNFGQCLDSRQLPVGNHNSAVRGWFVVHDQQLYLITVGPITGLSVYTFPSTGYLRCVLRIALGPKIEQVLVSTTVYDCMNVSITERVLTTDPRGQIGFVYNSACSVCVIWIDMNAITFRVEDFEQTFCLPSIRGLIPLYYDNDRDIHYFATTVIIDKSDTPVRVTMLGEHFAVLRLAMPYDMITGGTARTLDEVIRDMDYIIWSNRVEIVHMLLGKTFGFDLNYPDRRCGQTECAFPSSITVGLRHDIRVRGAYCGETIHESGTEQYMLVWVNIIDRSVYFMPVALDQDVISRCGVRCVFMSG